MSDYAEEKKRSSEVHHSDIFSWISLNPSLKMALTVEILPPSVVFKLAT